MTANKPFYFLLLVSLLLSLDSTACGQAVTPSATPVPIQDTPTFTAQPPTAAPTATAVPATATAIPATAVPAAATHTATTLPTATITATTTPTLPPTNTPMPTVEPTYAILRGEVTVDQAVCHYGPGKPYLYKYGVYKGSNLEVIARDPQANYVEIQAIRGNNPCWLNAEYLKIKGDVMTVKPVDPFKVQLPISPYYKYTGNVSAKREGNTVTVFWSPMVLRAGDDSLQVPYVIEAYVCQNGKMVFTPLGFYQTAGKVTDEPGCSEPSRGRFIAAEKHGYTYPVEVPWPQANGAQPATAETATPTPAP